ncbi:MAG: ATP-binding protein [Alphaproteobacteria bacterium]|nr:ATP-binding protein [Alphaproteobacteria bacterium]
MDRKFKKFFEIRTYFPKGITARMLILIILPILLSQILTGYIFYRRHWRTISNQNAIAFAGDVLTIVDLKKPNMTEEEFENLKKIAKKNSMMDIEWLPQEKIIKHKNSKRLEKLSLKYVYKFLNQNLKLPYTLYADEDKNILDIKIQYPDGILSISSSLKSVFSKTFYIFFLWMIGSCIIFIAISVPFAKSQVNAIKNLTRVISLAGRGEEIDGFVPSGPIQIRHAGSAFLKTYTRMYRYMKSRTNMLSGISHDLKTPLTRMKLELEFCDDKNLQFALLNDIEDMEKMIDSYLSFAKGMAPETSVKINITETVKNLIRKLNKGNFDISFESKKEYFATVRPLAFERAISNVIMNAIRYGKKKIAISIKKDSDKLSIFIEDNGPGIPEGKRDDMFKPFARLEKSRNSKTGGVGLGLSIVQEVIHQHGGEVQLLPSEKLGGLKVKIDLPLK